MHTADLSKAGRTIIYFENDSDTEPQADLEIRCNDSIVYTGPVVFTNIADEWHSLALRHKESPQRISIIHKRTGTRLDTLVKNIDSLTHVFLTYSYHQLTPEEEVGFKQNVQDVEEEKYMRSRLARSPSFSVLVMHGSISIP